MCDGSFQGMLWVPKENAIIEKLGKKHSGLTWIPFVETVEQDCSNTSSLPEKIATEILFFDFGGQKGCGIILANIWYVPAIS